MCLDVSLGCTILIIGERKRNHTSTCSDRDAKEGGKLKKWQWPQEEKGFPNGGPRHLMDGKQRSWTTRCCKNQIRKESDWMPFWTTAGVPSLWIRFSFSAVCGFSPGYLLMTSWFRQLLQMRASWSSEEGEGDVTMGSWPKLWVELLLPAVRDFI